MIKKKIYLLGLALLLLGGFLIFQNLKANEFAEIKNFDGKIEIYKSSSCGCCGIYGSYFKSKGNSNAKIIVSQDINSIKEKYGVPTGLTSCHTTIIGDYFVEGHVPLEAVEKLLKEKPDIAGIALPGMPSGSPGMPGQKYGKFTVYAVNKDGSSWEFMQV